MKWFGVKVIFVWSAIKFTSSLPQIQGKLKVLKVSAVLERLMEE